MDIGILITRKKAGVWSDITELGCYKLVDYAIKQGKVIKYFDKYCELSE